LSVKRKVKIGSLDASVSYVVVSTTVMKDTTVSFKIERPLKAKLVALAKADNRTLSNFIEKILKGEIAKYESKHGRINSSASSPAKRREMPPK